LGGHVPIGTRTRQIGWHDDFTFHLLLAVLVCQPASADPLYKWTDSAGRVTYSSTPPPGGVKAKTIKMPPPPSEEDIKQAKQPQPPIVIEKPIYVPRPIYYPPVVKPPHGRPPTRPPLRPLPQPQPQPR